MFRVRGVSIRGVVRQITGSPIDDFAIERPPEPGGDLERIFASGRCRRLHKWLHYLPIYERHFARYRGTQFRMLEIGVFGGGSLDMWREYFGPKAAIWGIDVNPACAALDTPETPVRIGSQADSKFLKSVVSEMGGLDIVLDDGSHIGRHQWESFETLFPLLSDGGLYVIEDSHTSYWWQWAGAYGRKRTAIGLAKQVIDDMHGWYHKKRTRTPAQRNVGCIHIHDSIIVIEKRQRARPGHVIISPKEPCEN